jgi:hypothetical protein
MTLSLMELKGIAETVAREFSPPLAVEGVASSDADTERVELLVTVTGCHKEPCTVVLNISRKEPSRFKAELEDQLRAVLRTHQHS